MIASIAVEDIYIVYLVKIMFLSICTENTCYTWVKARSEKRCDTSLFKSLSSSNLSLENYCISLIDSVIADAGAASMITYVMFPLSIS